MSHSKQIFFTLLAILGLNFFSCHAYTYRLCNAGNITVNGYLDLWACSNSGTDFSVAPGGYQDVDTGGCCLKGAYVDNNPIGNPVCSYENDDNCTYQRDSGCSSMTLVVSQDSSNNWSVQSAEGTLSCAQAAEAIANCS